VTKIDYYLLTDGSLLIDEKMVNTLIVTSRAMEQIRIQFFFQNRAHE